MSPHPARSAAVAVFLLLSCTPAPAAPQQPDVQRVESLVVEGTNAFRRAEGLGALRRNAALEEAARGFAEYLARTGEFDHEAGGTTPAIRATRQGYDYCFVAENIERQYSTAGFSTTELAARLVEGWKKSPGHRGNMLQRDVIDTAVAIAHRTFNGYQDYYAVQMFGRPKSANVQFQVRNSTTATVRYRWGGRPLTLGPGYTRTHTDCTASPSLEFDEVAGDEARVEPARGDKWVVRSRGGALSLARE